MAEAAKTPAPKNLFGDFWIEGELAVLFSDAGRGKSILGVQIAESIARGRSINPLPLPMTARAQKVLYFDFESTARQFEMRYSADPAEGDKFLRSPYRFSKNFHRVEPDIPRDLPEGFKTLEEYFLASIEETIRASRAKVVVIDSIAWLQGPNLTARHTVPLMRELKRLKAALGLSILVLAHNPRRDISRALSISGLQGAGVMCNFADSVFAIGQSRIDSGYRYIKHIKSRSTELTCDETNVLVGEIRKWEPNFLSFRFYKCTPESGHLAREISPLVRERVESVQEMYDKGMTQREIAAKLGISLGSVNRYLQMACNDDDDDNFDLDDGSDDENEPNEPSEPELAKPAKLAEPGRVSSPRVSKGASVGSPTVMEGADVTKLAELAEPAKPAELPYKSIRDKNINIGDIVQDVNGQLMKRTAWGWNLCADSVVAPATRRLS